MPNRIVHKRTGFIEFRSTPEEKLIKTLTKENTELKSEIHELKSSFSDVIRKVDELYNNKK